MTTSALPPTTSPMDPIYDALGEEIQRRMTSAPEGTPADLSPVARQLLAVPPGRLERVGDAGRFIHLLGFLSRQPGTDGRRAWGWAKQVAEPHGGDADVLGLLAALGDQLRQIDPSAASAIPPAELERLFRRSMELGPDRPTAFGRAALFFLHVENDAEAQRCFERAFDLDPSSGFIAQQLADLHGHENRDADGLAVLERCIRSTEPDALDPDVLWKAGLAATKLGRHEAAASHFGRLEAADPGRRWVAYYRAVALLELKRFHDAALAIEREAGLIQMPAALHVHAIRAAAAAGRGDADAVRRHVDAATRSPLAPVNYLAPAGVLGCFTRLWTAARLLDAGDTVVARLRERLLASGLTPVELWDDGRAGQPTVAGLTHYWVDLLQPLDGRWAKAGHALPGTEKWTGYRIRLGVLATDPDGAAHAATEAQRRSADLSPTVERVLADAGPYTAVPGVTRRGFPEPVMG